MLLEEMKTALAITHKMVEAMQDGELDNVEQMAQERDGILHQVFSGVTIPDNEKKEISGIVQQIVQLNNDMIEMGLKEKAAIQSEIMQDLKASSGIRKYLDNMS